MALNNLGLGFVFTARDLASGAIGNLERNFMSLDRRVGLGTENIQSAFQRLGVGLAVFTAGAATVGAAFSLANAAGRFEQAVASAGAIAGATAEELTRLHDAAIEAGLALLGRRAGAADRAGVRSRRVVAGLAVGAVHRVRHDWPLTCSGIRTNGNCQGFCAWYQTSGTYQCSRDYACGTTPPATSTCGSTAASFVSALCGCSSP